MVWPPPARTASVVPDWKWFQVQSLRGGGVMKVTTVGVDLAKSVFTVHGVDEHGNATLRKTVRRGKLLELFAQLPVSVVGAALGARVGQARARCAHHGGRVCRTYRRGGKNDANDA